MRFKTSTRKSGANVEVRLVIQACRYCASLIVVESSEDGVGMKMEEHLEKKHPMRWMVEYGD